MIVVSDASPLISFAILNKLAILETVFDEILIPVAVFSEITEEHKPYSKALEAFAHSRVKSVSNTLAVRLLLGELDTGESEAIVLAIENNIQDILIDEFKGRQIAKSHNLSPIGTIGVLIRAKQMGLIKQLKPELDLLVANRRRISESLYTKALELAGES